MICPAPCCRRELVAKLETVEPLRLLAGGLFLALFSIALTLPAGAASTAPVDELEHGVSPGVRPAPTIYGAYGAQGSSVPGGTAPAGSAAPGNGSQQPVRSVPPGSAGLLVNGGANQGGGQQPSAAAEVNPYVPLEDEHDAWRRAVAAPGQVAPGVRVLQLRDNKVGIVHARAFKKTLIRLPPCEEVTVASVGELVGFVPEVPSLAAGGAALARAKGIPLNEVEISPRVSGSDTSLHIRTRSGRLYAFQVFAEALNAKDVSDFTVLVEYDGACSAEGGAGGPAGSGTAGSGDFIRSIPFDAQKTRFDAYRAFGRSERDAWLAPEVIGFDGYWLLLDYGKRADLIAKPVALNVVEGVPSPAQQEWVGPEGTMLVVKSPSSLVMLQSGQSWLCIRRIDGSEPVGTRTLTIDPSLGRR